MPASTPERMCSDDPPSVVLLGCLCSRLRAGFAPAFFCLPVLTQPGGRVGYASGRSPWTTCLQFVYESKYDNDIQVRWAHCLSGDA